MKSKIFLLAVIIINLASLANIPLTAKAAKEEAKNITEENWLKHPLIAEVRKIYKEVKREIKRGDLTIDRQDFTKLPCDRGTYPLERKEIATDKKGQIRMYAFAQRISHGDLWTVEHYYDRSGTLRFMYMSNESKIYTTIENRIYLDSRGRVIWDVKKEGRKTTYGEIAADPYMVQAKTAALAKKEHATGNPECDNE